MLYFIAYALTFMFPTLGIISSFSGEIVLPYWQYFISAISPPLQGFWNFFAYVRPIVLKIKRKNDGNVTTAAAIKRIVVGFDGGSAVRRASLQSIPDLLTCF